MKRGASAEGKRGGRFASGDYTTSSASRRVGSQANVLASQHESGHCADSENPGLRALAKVIARQIAGTDLTGLEDPASVNSAGREA